MCDAFGAVLHFIGGADHYTAAVDFKTGHITIAKTEANAMLDISDSITESPEASWQRITLIIIQG